MRSIFLVAFLLFGGTMEASAAENGTSFDCAKARTLLDRLICADERLWPFERAFDAAYQDLRRRLPPDQCEALKTDDLRFIASMAKQCGVDRSIENTFALPAMAQCVAEHLKIQTAVLSQQIRAASAGTLYANREPLVAPLPEPKATTEAAPVLTPRDQRHSRRAWEPRSLSTALASS